MALVILAVVGCIRVTVNVGGRDADQRQAINVDPSIIEQPKPDNEGESK